jgi:hypothetical protein
MIPHAYEQPTLGRRLGLFVSKARAPGHPPLHHLHRPKSEFLLHPHSAQPYPMSMQYVSSSSSLTMIFFLFPLPFAVLAGGLLARTGFLAVEAATFFAGAFFRGASSDEFSESDLASPWRPSTSITMLSTDASEVSLFAVVLFLPFDKYYQRLFS